MDNGTIAANILTMAGEAAQGVAINPDEEEDLYKDKETPTLPTLNNN